MYPRRGLDELARRKARLEARIRLDRVLLAAHGRRLERPAAWVDRAAGWWRRTRAWWPWLGGTLASTLLFPGPARSWRRAGRWLRWAPWAWRVVAAVRRRPAGV